MVGYVSESDVFANQELKELIMKETLANSFEAGEMTDPDIRKEIAVDQEKIIISIKKA